MLENAPETTDDATANDAEKRPEDKSGADDRKRGDSTRPVEIGGRKGPDPTRYGDWEKNGRCIDF